MTEATNQLDDGLLASKASASSADHKHQGCTQTERGNTRGVTSAHILVADYQPQDWMASRHAGLLRDVLTNLPETYRGLRGSGLSHSHWSRFPSRAATNCGVSCSLRALPRINSVCFSDCRPSRTNTLAHQLPINRLADVPHVLALSKASLRPNNIGRSEREWRYLISVMRCPK